MSRRSRFLSAACCGVLLTAAAAAHDAIRGLGGKPIQWKSSQVAFTPNPAGSDDVADDSELLAVRLAFAEWNAALAGSLTFTESSVNAESLDVDDFKTHRIVFDEDDTTGYFPALSGVVALTPIRHTADSKILDADIVFNGRDHQFSTNLTPGTFDVRDVASHEAGHFAGLDHSPFLAASLYPYVKHQQTTHRSLSEDDRTGARRLYAANSELTGRLTGSVHLAKLDGNPGKALAGAHVTVRHEDGRTATGTLTKADGSFEFAALEPGAYVVSVAPLDGPMTPANLASNIPVDTDFGSTVVGSGGFPIPWVVNPGASTLVGAIAVPAATAPSIQTCLTPEPLTLAPGDAITFDTYGSGFLAGATMATSTPYVPVTQFVKYAGATGGSGVLSAAAGSSAANYDLVLADGAGGVAVEAGAVEVAFPGPHLTSISPPTGSLSGGTALAIHGTGFREGALVIVGDQVAAAVVSSANFIEAVSPPFAALPRNPVDVVVVNPDGQEGRLTTAFQPMAVLGASSLFPAAASTGGGTSLTLLGDGFVNGTSLRLVETTGSVESVDVPVSSTSLQQITFATPPLTEGDYDVEVSLPSGTPSMGPAIVTLTGVLHIVNSPDPKIHHILPAVAPISGGTGVRVLGAGFTESTKVLLGIDPLTGQGGVEVGTVVPVSPNEVQWIAPAAAGEGTVTLMIANEFGQASAPAEFEYVESASTSGQSVSTGGGGGPGCGAVWIPGAEPPSPADQAGAIASSMLALVAAAVIALRHSRARLAPAHLSRMIFGVVGRP